MSKNAVLNYYAAFGEDEWHRLSWPEGHRIHRNPMRSASIGLQRAGSSTLAAGRDDTASGSRARQATGAMPAPGHEAGEERATTGPAAPC